MNALWWYVGWTRLQHKILDTSRNAKLWRKVLTRKNKAVYRLESEVVRLENRK